MEKPRVYFSFRSPYSRLGLHIVARAKIDADLLPFTGPPEGVAFQDPVQNRAKRAYYGLDAPRMTMRMGLAIARPDPFEVDLTAANAAFMAARDAGKGLDFALAVSDARWGEGRNVSDVAVLEDCAGHIGWDAANIRRAADDPSIAEKFAAVRAAIEEDQAFGVPFAVFGPRKYWGHDRFDLLVEDVKSAG